MLYKWWYSQMTNLVDMDKSNWLCTIMIMVPLDVSEKIMFSRKLWTSWIGQVRTLMYFDYYIYHGILFLSILVNTCIAVKSSIQFVPRRKNNITKSFESANTTLRMQRMFFIKDYGFTHTRYLQFSNFKRRFFNKSI